LTPREISTSRAGARIRVADRVDGFDFLEVAPYELGSHLGRVVERQQELPLDPGRARGIDMSSLTMAI